jgi:hypothetical protein
MKKCHSPDVLNTSNLSLSILETEKSKINIPAKSFLKRKDFLVYKKVFKFSHGISDLLSFSGKGTYPIMEALPT